MSHESRGAGCMEVCVHITKPRFLLCWPGGGGACADWTNAGRCATYAGVPSEAGVASRGFAERPVRVCREQGGGFRTDAFSRVAFFKRLAAAIAGPRAVYALKCVERRVDGWAGAVGREPAPGARGADAGGPQVFSWLSSCVCVCTGLARPGVIGSWRARGTDGERGDVLSWRHVGVRLATSRPSVPTCHTGRDHLTGLGHVQSSLSVSCRCL
jgi:hypothetical protein